jgi:hypothetical protein
VEVLAENPWGKSAISDFDWLNDSILILGMSEQTFIVELNLNTKSARQIFISGISDVSEIHRIREGELIILDRRHGMWKYPVRKTKRGEFQNLSLSSQDNTFNYVSVFQDKAERRWLGTQTGLAVFEDDNAHLFRSATSMDIYSAAYDSSAKVCITSGYKGSLLWNIEDRECIQVPYDFKGISFWSIYFSREQGLFYSIENDRRLIAFHPARQFRQDVLLTSQINNGLISDVKTEVDGFMISHGAYLLKIHYTGKVDTLYENGERIFSFTLHNNDLYFSQLGKILKRDANGVVHLIYEENALVPPRDLIVVGDTALWFTQIHAGLGMIKLTSPEFESTVYGFAQGVTSQAIHSMTRHNDLLLLSGSFCMLTFDLKTQKVTDAFLYTDNQTHAQFIAPVHALDDQYYFTTTAAGIIVFPKHKAVNTLYGLRAQHLSVGDDDPVYNTALPLTLSYRQNDIRIGLETCYFGETDELHYAYKLTAEDPWIEVGQSPMLNFTRCSHVFMNNSSISKLK